jgi:hypothetical protein
MTTEFKIIPMNVKITLTAHKMTALILDRSVCKLLLELFIATRTHLVIIIIDDAFLESDQFLNIDHDNYHKFKF